MHMPGALEHDTRFPLTRSCMHGYMEPAHGALAERQGQNGMAGTVGDGQIYPSAHERFFVDCLEGICSHVMPLLSLAVA